MNSRRDFLKMALTLSALPAVLALGQNAFAQQKKKKKGDAGAAAGGYGMAVPGKGSAGAIKYVEDKSKVAKADQVEKGGIPFAKQDCANCILHQNGICTIMTDNNRKVKPTGWCPTWTHNPAIPA
jgi:hypothetical protein